MTDWTVMEGERQLRQVRIDKMERLSDEAVALHEKGDDAGAERKLALLRAVRDYRICPKCFGSGDVPGIMGLRECPRCDGEGCC